MKNRQGKTFVSGLILTVGWLLGPAQREASAQVFQGNLSTGSPVSEALRPGSYYNLHQVYLSAGQTYTIDVSSSDFDTYIFLLDGQRNAMAQNDDRASGDTNSRITFPISASGYYEVAVTTFKQGATGNYTASIQGSAPVASAVPQGNPQGTGMPGYPSSSGYYNPTQGGYPGVAYNGFPGGYNPGGGAGMLTNNANIAGGSSAVKMKVDPYGNRTAYNQQGQIVGYYPAASNMRPQGYMPGFGGGSRFAPPMRGRR